MSHRWNFHPLLSTDAELAAHLSKEMELHPVLGELLVKRGIRSVGEARRFFRPQLSDLHNPFLMNDMQEAVERLEEAMLRGDRILVYGDYDVDGVSSVALVYRFLRRFYDHIDFYIPDRHDEGYGVSQKGIDFAAASGVRLIVVLDCGIKAIDEVAYAQQLGIDFIICDHHVPADQLPAAAAILNAKRRDNRYPNPHLSGCGVGFKLMQAFAAHRGIAVSEVYDQLDLCAISIASDLVPITGENRVLAFHGLRQLNGKPSVGLRALIEVCGLSDKELSISDIVFRIGPRINASGRMKSGKEAVRLLVETDYQRALELAAQMNLYNEARKELDRQMTEEATHQVSRIKGLEEQRGIVIYNEEWHKGIIGIVASRVAEQYYRPAVVMTRHEDMATGSARSVTGFNVYKAVQSCADLLENFGGHTYAAGMTMRVENVEEFARRFSAYVAAHIRDEQTEASLDIQGELQFPDVTFDFYKQLTRFAPFGPGNERPLFCTHRVYDYGTSKVVGRGQEHIKLELVANHSSIVMNGIAFGQSSQARYIKTRRAFDICYAIEENSHKRGEVQLQIEDIKPCE